jgi:hypothetical protein
MGKWEQAPTSPAHHPVDTHYDSVWYNSTRLCYIVNTIQREGFHLKSPKTDSNFFGGGGWVRVSSHLCLLTANFRVPWNNVANFTKSVWICLGMLTTLTQSANWEKTTLVMDIPKMWGWALLSSSCRPLIWRMRAPSPFTLHKRPCNQWRKEYAGVRYPPITLHKLEHVFKYSETSIQGVAPACNGPPVLVEPSPLLEMGCTGTGYPHH